MLNSNTPSKTGEVVRYFLKLGCTGFGGPLAMISNMQRDLVVNRNWIENDHFTRAFSLIKAMPGPIAFQTAVFLGRSRAGWKGGLAAAIAINAPAFLLMILFGVYYERWQGLSGGPAFLSGMQAAALGVILASLKSLGKSHFTKVVFWCFALIAILCVYFAPWIEPLLIITSGGISALLFLYRQKMSCPDFLKKLKLTLLPSWELFLFGNTSVWNTSTGLVEPLATLYYSGLQDLFWSCFKSGAIVFGSGLAIVPLLENDFVQKLNWLSHQEFMNALAFGQITPGPVVITATFIGFKKFGFIGALTGTLAIFMASFFHMMTWFPSFIDRLARLSWISAFLTGALAAVIGAIFTTTLQLSWALEMKAVTFPILLASMSTALLTKTPPWLLIPIGGVLAYLSNLLFRI